MSHGIKNETTSSRGFRREMVGLLVCGLMIAGALFTASPALADSVLGPSPTSQEFGTLDIHSHQTITENYFNNSASPTTVQSVAILGNDASSFSIQPGQDFCSGQTIPAFMTCRLNVIFGPLSSPSPKAATLELVDDTGTVDVPLSGAGITGTPTLNSSALDFGSQVVNQGNSNQQSVTVATGPDAGVQITNVQVIGTDAPSFNVQGNGCQGFTMGPDSTCQIYLQFQPSSAGSKHAQLEIDNDGTAGPLFVSLSGVGLNGPRLTLSPRQAIFGNVALGSSTSQTFTLTNTGDAPLQLQELFIVAGSPQVFPIVDGCSGQQLAPGAACTVTVGFIPIALGGKDAALLVISNQAGVTTIGLSGTGVAPNAVSSGTPPTRPTKAPVKNGLVELVTCNTITKTLGKRVHAKRENVKISSQICTTQTVTGPRKVTTAPLAHAVLSRGSVVYATGMAARDATHPKLALNVSHTLRAGSYTLTLRWTTARTTHTTHQTITLR